MLMLHCQMHWAAIDYVLLTRICILEYGGGSMLARECKAVLRCCSCLHFVCDHPHQVEEIQLDHDASALHV